MITSKAPSCLWSYEEASLDGRSEDRGEQQAIRTGRSWGPDVVGLVELVC